MISPGYSWRTPCFRCSQAQLRRQPGDRRLRGRHRQIQAPQAPGEGHVGATGEAWGNGKTMGKW